MAAIDQDLTDELFKYVDFARNTLPVIETVVEVAFPELAPEIELIKLGQTKLFEILSVLQSAPPVDLDETKARLRDETLAAWRARRA